MADGTRDRVFAWLGSLAVRRPGPIVAVIALLVLACVAAIPGLSVSTSRYGLVSEDNPYQARMLRFFERFGYPDVPTLLISGGTPEQRRAIVDRLSETFEGDPELAGRVLGRVDPKDFAELLLLHQPDGLATMRASIPPNVELADVVEAGLPRWLSAIENQIYGGLEGEGAADVASAEIGLRQLASAAKTFDDYLAGKDVLGDALAAQAEREPTLDDAGYTVAGDGEYHIIALFPDLPGDEVEDLRPLVERIRTIRDTVMRDAPQTVSADVTGLPALTVDEADLLGEGLLRSSLAAGLGIMLLCLALFRSLRQTIIAFLPLVAGIAITLGIVRLTYGRLNLITSSFVAVLLGLGIDFAVHQLTRYHEQLRGGRSVPEAIRDALVFTGPGIMTGALTTALAFLTTTTTEFTAYAELGVITAVGLVVIVAATFLLLPPLLVTLGGGAAKAMPEPPGFALLTRVVRAARYPVLILSTAAGIAGAFMLPNIEFNARYFDFLPDETESARGLLKLEHDPVLSPVFANLSAEGVADVRDMATRLRALPTVAGVQTATDVIPALGEDDLANLRKGFSGLARDPDFSKLSARKTSAKQVADGAQKVADALDEVRFALEQADRGTEAAVAAKDAFIALKERALGLGDPGQARLSELEREVGEYLGRAWTTARRVAERGGYHPGEDLPEVLRRRFVSNDGKALALYVVPSGNIWDSQVAAAFASDMEAIDPGANGLAMNQHEHTVMIVDGFRRAAAIAAGLIFVMLLIDFRSVGDAALALVPTVLGWLWMLAIMAVTGIRFNVANIVTLPLVLGIGIAFGVHLVHRYRESAASRGLAALDDVVRGTGGAVVVAALTTMVGFGGLTVVRYRAMFSLGSVMVLGIGTCLLASVLVLPALLVVLRRAE